MKFAIALILGLLTYLTLQINAPIHVPKPADPVVMGQSPGEIFLPEDANLYYTTLFLPKDYKSNTKSRDLVSWFESNDRLRALKAQTHFNLYTEDSVLYKARYAKSVQTVPCISVNDQTGKVLYIARGKNIPSDSDTLANEIADNLNQITGRRRRQCIVVIQPQPVAEPEPEETEPDSEITDTVEGQKLPIAGGILVAALAAAAGAFSEYRSKKNDA